jgi:hypothetical protein
MADDDKKTGEGEKLYAGKFKTVEELESGYKNSAVVYDENATLKKQVDDLSKVPETYMNPNDVELDATRLVDIQARAKEAGMTQAQYDKFVRSDKARLERNKQNFENAKKEVGEETMNLLKDYVGKHYPKELQENMINTFIGNKDARQAALNHRAQLLNNQVPGMNKTAAGGGYRVTDDDIRKAYLAKEGKSGDIKSRMAAQNHYMNLIAAKAEQDRAN